jgi:hypothetical protein
LGPSLAMLYTVCHFCWPVARSRTKVLFPMSWIKILLPMITGVVEIEPKVPCPLGTLNNQDAPSVFTLPELILESIVARVLL